MYKIQSPLEIVVAHSKKKDKDVKFILNTNQYRNFHFRLLNTAKIRYKEFISEQLRDKPKYNKVMIVYKVHKGDKRRHDIGNILAIHQKFFEDAMVELGHLPDDNSKNIPFVVYTSGSIEVDNPRVDIFIYDMDNRSDMSQLKKVVLKEIIKKIENK